MAAEQKIQRNVAMTARQIGAVEKEAKRLQISFSDMMRRIIDEWGDRKPSPATSQKLYGTN